MRGTCQAHTQAWTRHGARLRCSGEVTGCDPARYERLWTYDERWSVVKHDEPKSITLTSQREYERIKMFSGLRSQWIKLSECTKCSASQT